MVEFPNKIFTILLVFLMLVVAPLTWQYVRSDMRAERLALNEVSQFIDRVTDKGSITQEDIDDLYLGVNATGGTYDVQVKRYIRQSIQTSTGETKTLYLSDDYKGDMNLGDVVKVTVEEIGISPAKRLLWSLLRVDEGQGSFTLAGSVR